MMMSIGAATVGNSTTLPQKINNGSPAHSGNSTSGCIREGNEISVSERHLRPRDHCSIIRNSHHVETTEVSAYTGMDQKDVREICVCVHTYVDKQWHVVQP